MFKENSKSKRLFHTNSLKIQNESIQLGRKGDNYHLVRRINLLMDGRRDKRTS
jgi:hypothetical protein